MLKADKNHTLKIWNMRTLSCTHGGTFKARGLGKRDTKSGKQACGSKIYAGLDRKDRNKIVVKQMITEHNHETCPEFYERYAMQRKLDDSEKQMSEKLVRLNVPSKSLRTEVVRVTGKKVTMQDIHNLKKAVRQKDKEGALNGNDAQLLVKELNKWRRQDSGLTAEYGIDKDNVLQYIFVQTSEMRNTFQKFPVCIDCTYCINDRDIPLLSFLAVDGNS